ncbi:MAG: aminoglycoside phosphotransferase family protein [Rickettsiales bacterium]|nr:aminoglycoside phosphotransferase family protein [Rickettsiales bacterium]
MSIKRIKSLFPNEKLDYLASGVKSAVFKTESGKIIRVKPIFFGTYEKERRILDFIKSTGGGIGCETPSLSCFVRGFRAYSVHDGICGTSFDYGEFSKLAPARQKQFAEQLAAALLKLYQMGGMARKNGDKKLFARRDWFSFFRNFRQYLLIRKYIKKAGIWRKLSRLRESVAAPGGGLIHGDLHGKNIICGEDFDLAGIIDFDGARFGHFEHNLRKLGAPLVDLVTDWCDKNMEKKLNSTRLDYYRMAILIKKIRNARDKSAAVKELESLLS